MKHLWTLWALLKHLWLWFLARFHLSDEAVCKLSQGRDSWDDYHDYCDTEAGVPEHFCFLTCKRCGKIFTM